MKFTTLEEAQSAYDELEPKVTALEGEKTSLLRKRDELLGEVKTLKTKYSKFADYVDQDIDIASLLDIKTKLRQDVIEFEQPSEQGIAIQRYKGRAVIVDDGLPKVAGGTSGYIYSTYMFGLGAIAYGEGAMDADEAVETDRDILAGDDYLTNRRHFILHPQGVKWIGTAAGASPTNAELATGTNWSRVYQRKNVRLICLQTNG
jgi:hypothetical protein